MKYITSILSFFIIYTYSIGQEDTTNYVITTSQQFDFSLSVSRDSIMLSDAVNSLREVILNEDSTAFLVDEEHDISKEIYRLLFDNINPKNTYEYHLLSITGNTSNVDIKLMLRNNLSEYGSEYKDMLIVIAIYNIRMIKINGKWLLDARLQTDDMCSKKIENITFFANSLEEIKTIKKRKFLAFQKHLLSIFHIKKKELNSLSYFTGNRLNGFAPLGFDYSLQTTGMFLRDADVLLNVTENVLDKHELTHYFLQKFKLRNKFINEGIAVYYGGSNNYQPEEFRYNEKNFFKTLDTGDQLEIISAFLDGEILPQYSTEFYFLSHEIICLFVEKYSENSLYDLVSKFAGLTPKQLIEKYKLFPMKSLEYEILNYCKDEN